MSGEPGSTSTRRSVLGLRFAAIAGLLVTTALWLAGCATTPRAPVGPRASSAEIPYLRSPLEGFPRTLDAASRQLLETASRELREGGSTAAASAVAAELLAGEPELDPALVLRAQVALVEGDFGAVMAEMKAVTQRLPTYRAAWLLLARAAELSGELPLARTAYAAVGETDELALEAARRTESGALEMLAAEVSASIDRGRLATAAAELDQMQGIDPAAEVTLRAAIDVGRATGDPQIELVALRTLSVRLPDDRDLALRRAALEVEIGDVGTGLRVLQQLAASTPDDPRLVEELERARFRWRLELLPADVQGIARRDEISRADFATLLFWLAPAVRYGPTAGGRIATDILDHRRKEEIIRVVNHGLMRVDPGLHTFAPDAPLRRLDALEALLRLMEENEPPAACLGGRTLGPSPPARGVCEAAASCGLIGADAECFPGATVDGGWAVEASRQALNRLGI